MNPTGPHITIRRRRRYRTCGDKFIGWGKSSTHMRIYTLHHFAGNCKKYFYTFDGFYFLHHYIAIHSTFILCFIKHALVWIIKHYGRWISVYHFLYQHDKIFREKISIIECIIYHQTIFYPVAFQFIVPLFNVFKVDNGL